MKATVSEILIVLLCASILIDSAHSVVVIWGPMRPTTIIYGNLRQPLPSDRVARGAGAGVEQSAPEKSTFQASNEAVDASTGLVSTADKRVTFFVVRTAGAGIGVVQSVIATHTAPLQHTGR